MRHALLDHAFGHDVLLVYLTAVLRLDDLEYGLVISHAFRVHGGLRHETVWQWDVDDAGDKASTAEQEEVPVEAARFLERELFRLRRNAALILLIPVVSMQICSQLLVSYMVVVKKKHEQEPDR